MIFKKEKFVPIIGVRGSGKTSFLISLGLKITINDWGLIEPQAARDYIDTNKKYVFKAEPIPATVEKTEMKIEVNNFTIEGESKKKKLVLKTYDYPGQELVQELDRWKDQGFKLPDSGLLRDFVELYKRSHALILIVDIVRNKKAEPSTEDIIQALVEQILPLARSLDLYLKLNKKKRMNLLFIFTKSDFFRYSNQELKNMIKKTFSLQLAFLRKYNSTFHVIKTVAAGYQKKDEETKENKEASLDEILDSFGYRTILEELFKTL